MSSQEENNPFLNPDGSVNKEQMMRVFGDLLSEKPAEERFASNPEWTTARITSIKWIIGAFACCAIRHSPYEVPTDLEKVLGYLSACLRRSAQWDEKGYANLSLLDIYVFLQNILVNQKISVFDAWASPKKAWKKDKFKSSAEAIRSSPDYDFVVTEAILLDTCILIRDERRSIMAFLTDLQK